MAHRFTRKLQALIAEIKANGLYDVSIHDTCELQKLFDVGSALAELLTSQQQIPQFHGYIIILEQSLKSRVAGLRNTLQEGLN